MKTQEATWTPEALTIHLRCEPFTLTQWCVTVAGKEHGMFTPVDCDTDTAMAIAVATFGRVDSLKDEGKIRERITWEQLAKR